MIKNRSFTLIEVILAISIFTLTVGGSFVLIQQTVNAVSIANSKLTAYYLAQEGIEIARNFRDNNWLKQRTNPVTWKDGLAEGIWEVDYNDAALVSYVAPGRDLYIDTANGFYLYPDVPLSNHAKTKFKRKITISPGASNDDIYVESKVEWTEKTRTHNVKVTEHLFNWYGY